jgi:hypothetical protein
MVVGSFFLKSADETTVVNATNVNTAAGWSFLPSPVNGAYTYPFSNLQPAYPKSVLTSPATMWVVIAQ